MKTVKTKFSELMLLHELQARKRGVDHGVVTQYAANMRDGDQFPPIVAFRITDRNFPFPAVVAGFHRYVAAEQCGMTEFEVELHEGTFKEAFVYAFRSNLEHKGLRYSNDDKRRAAEMALKLYQKKSARFVAELIGLSHRFVALVRKELEGDDEVEVNQTVEGKDGVPQKSKGKSNKGKRPVETVSTGLSPPSDSQQVVKAWVVQEPEVEQQVVRVIVREEPREDKVVYVHTVPCDMNEGGYYQHGIPARIGNDLGASADEMDTAVSILLRATPEQRAEIMRRSNLAPVRTPNGD